MKKKYQSENIDPFETWDQPSYQTGSTQPPKSYKGVVAFLLVVVIFLCGLATALSVMNFRLLELLDTKTVTEPPPVAFSQGEELVVPDSAVEFPLGFAGQAIPEFWQDYHDLPAGIYVAEVTESGLSRSAGLQPGDILTALDDTPIADEVALQTVLEAHRSGDLLEARICRDGETIILSLTME